MNYEGAFRTDNKGELFMYGRDAFYDYFRQNPDAQFTFKIEKVSRNTTDRIIAYWNVEVLPKLIAGFRDTGDNHNKKSVAQEMKKYCPTFNEEDKEFEELNYFKMCRVVDECIIFAAENLEIVIENPK